MYKLQYRLYNINSRYYIVFKANLYFNFNLIILKSKVIYEMSKAA